MIRRLVWLRPLPPTRTVCPGRLIGAVRLGVGDIADAAVAALRSRMHIWSGAAPRLDV